MSLVLVVDDDAAVRESICDVLSAHGHEVEAAADGREALERLSSEPAVECMVLDMYMPRLDGEGVLAELDDGPAVVLLSAFQYVSRTEVERRYAQKICDSLAKPVAPRALVRTVNRCVGAPD